MGKLQGVQTNINKPGYKQGGDKSPNFSPKRTMSPRKSPKRKVDFNLGEDEGKRGSPPLQLDTTMKQYEFDQKKLNMDPSSAVIDLDPINFDGDLSIGKVESFMSP